MWEIKFRLRPKLGGVKRKWRNRLVHMLRMYQSWQMVFQRFETFTTPPSWIPWNKCRTFLEFSCSAEWWIRSLLNVERTEFFFANNTVLGKRLNRSSCRIKGIDLCADMESVSRIEENLIIHVRWRSGQIKWNNQSGFLADRCATNKNRRY